jgi:hypothetical protein
MIQQAWAFPLKNILKNLDVRIKIHADVLGISVVKDFQPSYWKLNEQCERWLKQAVITKRITIKIYTIAPPLPQFLPRTQTVIPRGNRREVYVLNVSEVKLDLPEELVTSISQFLSFNPDSREGRDLIEAGQRLEVVLKENLLGKALNRVEVLRNEGFDCRIVTVASSAVGSHHRSKTPKEILIDVQVEDPSLFDSVIRGIAGGSSQIRYWTKEDLVFCICEVRNPENWKAIVVPLHFAKSLSDELRNQRDLTFYFRVSTGKQIGLIMANVRWLRS